MPNSRAANFDTLILAGLGAVGSALVKLGKNHLESYVKIILVDREAAKLEALPNGMHKQRGDIGERAFLDRLLNQANGKALFVNLGAEVNNLAVRRALAPRDTAYLDSCASATDRPEEHRFSRMMPHTLTPVESRLPHWLCWGINPGMVEIIARRLINELDGPDGSHEITVFEYDALHAPAMGEALAVGWCPEGLIEEVMQSPSLVVENGEPQEDKTPGAQHVLAFWEGKPVPSRLVAHEDIWNMALIPGVDRARFIYGLDPGVMAMLAGDIRSARQGLRVPPANVPVFGLEQVAVEVRNNRTKAGRCLVWKTDHHATWQQHGINAVQFQTASSLLLAMELLQKTEYGARPGTFCAANLPVRDRDRRVVEQTMDSLGIDWRDGAHLGLYAKQCPAWEGGELCP